MNIYHFEDDIDKTIVQRGCDYYNAGRVVNSYHQGDREYVFEVEGSDDYEVVVNIDERGNILHSRCDCPYDMGPVCKHEVAVYCELRDMVTSKGDSRDEAAPPETAAQPSLEETLNRLPKEDLVGIILDLAREDEIVRNVLLVKYAQGGAAQELEQCRKLIDAIVRKYTGRKGMVEYRETYRFTYELSEVLQKARDTENAVLALDIAFLLLKEAIDAFQYADDSGGDIGSLVAEALELIGEIARENHGTDTGQGERIFDNLLDRCDGAFFGEWDEHEIELLGVCGDLADTEPRRNKLRMKIEYLLRGNDGNEYKKYSSERMLGLLFHMIEQHGTAAEAEQFIRDNVRFPAFRERLINTSMQSGDFNQVVELALQGETQDRTMPGLAVKWKKLRYTAYQELALQAEQEKLARELLFDGHFEYYGELRRLAGGDAKALYDRLKYELPQSKGWSGTKMYLKLIEEENDLDEMMAYVREHPDSIETYAARLAERFEDEVIAVYRQHIRTAAGASSNRKNYEAVRAMLLRFKKIAGSGHAAEMVRELKMAYARRPAFIDELNNVR